MSMAEKAKGYWCLAERVTNSNGVDKINFFRVPSFKTKDQGQEYLDTKARLDPYFAERKLEVTFYRPEPKKKPGLPSGKRRNRR
jgi:hypothetical protein